MYIIIYVHIHMFIFTRFVSACTWICVFRLIHILKYIITINYISLSLYTRTHVYTTHFVHQDMHNVIPSSRPSGLSDHVHQFDQSICPHQWFEWSWSMAGACWRKRTEAASLAWPKTCGAKRTTCNSVFCRCYSCRVVLDARILREDGQLDCEVEFFNWLFFL